MKVSSKVSFKFLAEIYLVFLRFESGHIYIKLSLTKRETYRVTQFGELPFNLLVLLCVCVCIRVQDGVFGQFSGRFSMIRLQIDTWKALRIEYCELNELMAQWWQT